MVASWQTLIFVFQKVIISRIYMQYLALLDFFSPARRRAAEMRLRAVSRRGVNPGSEMETNEVLPPRARLQTWREKTRCQPAHFALCKVRNDDNNQRNASPAGGLRLGIGGGHICSTVSMPRVSKPCFSTCAARSHNASREARVASSALSTGQFS